MTIDELKWEPVNGDKFLNTFRMPVYSNGVLTGYIYRTVARDVHAVAVGMVFVPETNK